MPFLGLAHPVSRAGIGAKSAKEYTPLTVLYKHVYDIYCVMIYTKTPEQLRTGPRGRAAASRRNGCPGRVGEGWLVRDVVKRLRRKLGEDGSNPRYVFAEPRAGYRMARPDRDPVRRRGNRPRPSRQKTAHTDGRRVGTRSMPSMREPVAGVHPTLRRAVASADGPPSSRRRQEPWRRKCSSRSRTRARSAVSLTDLPHPGHPRHSFKYSLRPPVSRLQTSTCFQCTHAPEYNHIPGTERPCPCQAFC